MNRRFLPSFFVAVSATGVLLLTGCLERTIQVASSPPGADAHVNDTPIGRTPSTTAFEFYGHYDVRLRKDGYEPVAVDRKASMPLWEIPPFDLIASVLPITIRDNQRWDFQLEPSPDMGQEANRDAIIQRARVLRDELSP